MLKSLLIAAAYLLIIGLALLIVPTRFAATSARHKCVSH